MSALNLVISLGLDWLCYLTTILIGALGKKQENDVLVWCFCSAEEFRFYWIGW